MTFFELLHTFQRFFYALFGRKMCSLDDFYLLTLQKRNFIEKAKALTPKERLAFILQQDKEIFNAWKEIKNLSPLILVFHVVPQTFRISHLRS